MLLDNISKPETMWKEDENGNKFSYDARSSSGFFPQYGHYESVAVTHSIYVGHKDPKWPIRLLKWIIQRMPNSWQGQNVKLASVEKTINGAYPIVKYLVEKRNFSFNESCVVASNLCESCYNLCLLELEGRDINKYQRPDTMCDYCELIDRDYFERRRVKGCYLAYEAGESVAGAYKNGRFYKPKGPLAGAVAVKETNKNIFTNFIKKIFKNKKDQEQRPVQ